MRRNSISCGSGAKAGLAGLLIALLLWLATLAATSTFHQSLHQDAHDGGHHCVICVFAHGQVDAATVHAVAALVVMLWVGSLPLAHTPRLARIDLRLAPGRGPPPFSVHSAR